MSTSPATGPARLLGDDDRAELRTRWLRISERFVDDPAGAVRAADELVEQTIDHIRSSLDRRRATTRDGWAELDDATTEQLREALHRYEVLFEKLANTPAPDAWHDQPD